MVYLINSGTDSHMLHGESHGNPIRGLREVASKATDVLPGQAPSIQLVLLLALRLQNALFYNTFAACEARQASK